MSKEIELYSSTEGCSLASYVDKGCYKHLGVHIRTDESDWSSSVFLNKDQVEELIDFLNNIKSKVGN